MKNTWLATSLGCALIAMASHAGLIGFTYPRIIDTEPLLAPAVVVKVENTVVTLEDGTRIEIQGLTSEEIKEVLRESHQRLDIKTSANLEERLIYANRNGWVCGTPWATPLTLPLVPQTVYKNRREFVAFGIYVADQDEHKETEQAHTPDS